MSSTRSAMIEVHQLRKIYRGAAGDIAALDGLDLSVPRGEIHGIVGPSGAGKSTLIRCLTGLTQPTSGSVQIDGQEITSLSGRDLRERRRHIGLVFQDVNLFESRTAAQNIEYPLTVAQVDRQERRQRVTELLELVGLADRGDALPSQLSGGQQQRIGIARALATRPPVLLCDEPSSALDWATTRQVLTLISRVRDELGVTVVIITHEMSVVRQICDSASRLEAGRITESGPLIDLVSGDSENLAAELLPLASPLSGTAGEQVEVTASSRDVEISAALRLLSGLSPRSPIVSGAIETVSGGTVARFRLGVDSRDHSTIVEELRAAGLTVSEVS